jgi:hypothetical protein
MKSTIIPDYLRHTTFTIEERLMLDEIARARVLIVIRLRILVLRRDQMIVSEVDDRVIDDYDNQIAHLKWTITSLDQTIFEVYQEHGRLN